MLNGWAYWECMGTRIIVQLIFPCVCLFYNFFLTSVSAWFLIVNKASDRGWTSLYCFWLRLRCHVDLLRINNFFIVCVCLLLELIWHLQSKPINFCSCGWLLTAQILSLCCFGPSSFTTMFLFLCVRLYAKIR